MQRAKSHGAEAHLCMQDGGLSARVGGGCRANGAQVMSKSHGVSAHAKQVVHAVPKGTEHLADLPVLALPQHDA